MASRKSVVFKITMDVYAKTTEAKVRVSSNDAFPICQLSFDAFPFSSEDTKFFIRQPQNQSRFTKLFFAFPKFDFWSFVLAILVSIPVLDPWSFSQHFSILKSHFILDQNFQPKLIAGRPPIFRLGLWAREQPDNHSRGSGGIRHRSIPTSGTGIGRMTWLECTSKS
jgi:hypothetical protein